MSDEQRTQPPSDEEMAERRKRWSFPCPHAVPDCETCERSAVARELRDLRRVYVAARRYFEQRSTPTRDILEDTVEMAKETCRV